jgi:flagellar motor switch protein FliN/FliY
MSPAVWQLRIKLADNDLPPLLYLIEPSASAVVNPFAALEEAPETELQIADGQREHSYGFMVHQFLDLELPLSVVLGRALLPIRDVLKFTSGSIVELDRKVGDQVEVVVQGKVVARGEVVSVKGNYAVRITEVACRRDRMAVPRALEAA